MKLTLQNISKRFEKNGGFTPLFSDISYTFSQGLSYAITGISGTGKSTLLALLAGIEKPTSGVILVNDQNINFFNDERRSLYLNEDIGLIFQVPHLIKELSVIQNVMIKGIIAGGDIKKNYEYAEELLNKVGLLDKAHANTAILSGGEQQRVAIIRAVFSKPSFIIADEPTAHLDYENKKIVINLLKEYMNEFRIGLIISTHDLSVAQELDVKLRLHSGMLISDGYVV